MAHLERTRSEHTDKYFGFDTNVNLRIRVVCPVRLLSNWAPEAEGHTPLGPGFEKPTSQQGPTSEASIENSTADAVTGGAGWWGDGVVGAQNATRGFNEENRVCKLHSLGRNVAMSRGPATQTPGAVTHEPSVSTRTATSVHGNTQDEIRGLSLPHINVSIAIK